MAKVVVIADYNGQVYGVLPVTDDFTENDMPSVQGRAEYYNQTATLIEVESVVSKTITEVEAKIAYYNGDDLDDNA